MKQNNRKTGARYEREAGEYLKQLGYQILEYNYRCRIGEIDIVAKDGDCLVFCEVKYRKDSRKGHPLEAVDARKQRVLSKCAIHYIMRKGSLEQPGRFDVIGIIGDTVMHVKNAFEWMM